MTELQLRQLLATYLGGKTSLRDVDRAISSVAWDTGASDSVKDLSNEIALRIDEFSSHGCAESDLKSVLVPFVTDYSVLVHVGPTPAPPFLIQTSGSSTFRTSPVRVKSTISDRSLVAVP